MQSAAGAGHARTRPPLLHAGSRSRAGLGSRALGKGRARERGASGSSGGAVPASALTLSGGCWSPGGARCPGKGRPHGGRAPPGPADGREQGQAPGAQGAGRRGRGGGIGGGEREGGGGSRSPGRAAHSPGLWPPAAGAGFFPEPRSFLPFPLPLPSLRSDISPEKCTLCADGARRRRRATSLVQGLGSALGKVCPSRAGRTTGRAAARALRGARLLSPAGSAGTRRAVRATWDWRSRSLSGRLLSRREVLGSRRCRLLSRPRSGTLAARGGRGDHRPASARVAQQPPSPRSCPPREPGVPTSWGELLAGSFSIAPPPTTSRPQVGRWRLLLALPWPRPLPRPRHTPTPRRGHATGRSLGSALAGAAPFPPRAGLGGGRCAGRLPGTPDRGRWKPRAAAAAAAAPAGAGPRVPGRFRDPGRDPDPGPSLLAPLPCQSAPGRAGPFPPARRKWWRQILQLRHLPGQIKALEPVGRRGTAAIFSLEFGVPSFL